MWNRGLISIGMHITKTQGKYVVQSVPEQGEGLVGIERGIYQFLKERREIKYIFWNTALKTHVKKHLEPIHRELEQFHLMRTKLERSRAWKSTIFIAILIAVVGITRICLLVTVAGGGKFYPGTPRGASVFFLIFVLIGLIITLLIVLTPWSSLTQLGKRYIQTLEDHFGWVEKSIKANETPEGVDPTFAIAIFGIGILAGTNLYGTFGQAFLTKSVGQSGAGGGGCGGCGG